MYADVIIDISLEKLDRAFAYRVPAEWEDQIAIGSPVKVPFGRGGRTVTGYVLGLSDEPSFDRDKIKDLIAVQQDAVPIESELIALAAWMREHYGGTMNQALKTVIPIKRKEREKRKEIVALALEPHEARQRFESLNRKNSVARKRLLDALLEREEIPKELLTGKLGVTSSVIHALEAQGIVKVTASRDYRNPVKHAEAKKHIPTLNPAQDQAVRAVRELENSGRQETFLLHGVTGSGKTEVYMELIASTLARGKQAIVLIPEIALTYQTVSRFYQRFGDRVSIMNSRLSPGERYDQFERAKNGEVDIMIGPRSALFTPFPNLGMVIIDEEHETSYKSEAVPRYHARETAIQRARMCGATVILGSATPSLESYYRAKNGEYHLLELKDRVEQKPLPACHIVDMRQELRKGNHSILSAALRERMADRLQKKEQVMLFLNRRGIAGFLSCRACGYVPKCPHCDVSLSKHRGGRMVCHYCGYEEREPSTCPSCGSKYIGGFKAGTQKVEEIVKKSFPDAVTLRMDFDTTRTKDSYENILGAFSNGEADILIGTQMIVKGHDFPNVTLVGVLAADMSLHVADYHCAERTFQLLTQAAGRAGRGNRPGEVVIQAYDPGHYSIEAAKSQDYGAFYEQEIRFRRLLRYPPVWNMLVIHISSKDEEVSRQAAEAMAGHIRQARHAMPADSRQGIVVMPADSRQGIVAMPTDSSQSDRTQAGHIRQARHPAVELIGPASPAVAKINDFYRQAIYLKSADYQALVAIKDDLERELVAHAGSKDIQVQFDFNPAYGV